MDDPNCILEKPVHQSEEGDNIDPAKSIIDEGNSGSQPQDETAARTSESPDATPQQEQLPQSSALDETQPSPDTKSSQQLDQQTTETPTPDIPVEPLTTPGVKSDVKEVTAPSAKKTKDEEKLGIYKALAIKLKKELVKTRDELNKTRESNEKEISELRNKLQSLEDTLNNERICNSTTSATHEATIKRLKAKLDSSEDDLKSIQTEFENYKVRASQIMQQNHSGQSNGSKAFEEERYKQLRDMNEDQKNRLTNLEVQLAQLLAKNRELESEKIALQEQLESARDELKAHRDLRDKCTNLTRVNDNLRIALKQFGEKFKTNPASDDSNQSDSTNNIVDAKQRDANKSLERDRDGSPPPQPIMAQPVNVTETRTTSTFNEQGEMVSPSISLKDECHTNNSSPSTDGSTTSGYVHIKPTTFEIISRSSLLEDAQNQIDNLTKAYLDSESTNSLLSEQVRALKEEIRRIQRGTERMDLAENLEYLKNVLFKFLSLDDSQLEQKQRLVPVLSTVLKLSPNETAKLNSLAVPERTSMASSLFKLGGVGGGG